MAESSHQPGSDVQRVEKAIDKVSLATDDCNQMISELALVPGISSADVTMFLRGPMSGARKALTELRESTKLIVSKQSGTLEAFELDKALAKDLLKEANDMVAEATKDADRIRAVADRKMAEATKDAGAIRVEADRKMAEAEAIRALADQKMADAERRWKEDGERNAAADEQLSVKMQSLELEIAQFRRDQGRLELEREAAAANSEEAKRKMVAAEVQKQILDARQSDTDAQRQILDARQSDADELKTALDQREAALVKKEADITRTKDRVSVAIDTWRKEVKSDGEAMEKFQEDFQKEQRLVNEVGRDRLAQCNQIFAHITKAQEIAASSNFLEVARERYSRVKAIAQNAGDILGQIKEDQAVLIASLKTLQGERMEILRLLETTAQPQLEKEKEFVRRHEDLLTELEAKLSLTSDGAAKCLEVLEGWVEANQSRGTSSAALLAETEQAKTAVVELRKEVKQASSELANAKDASVDITTVTAQLSNLLKRSSNVLSSPEKSAQHHQKRRSQDRLASTSSSPLDTRRPMRRFGDESADRSPTPSSTGGDRSFRPQLTPARRAERQVAMETEREGSDGGSEGSR